MMPLEIKRVEGPAFVFDVTAVPFLSGEHKGTEKKFKESEDAKAGKERKRKIFISPICGEKMMREATHLAIISRRRMLLLLLPP